MFGFPASTEFNKRIPKQTFYENLDITPSLKRLFVDQIKTIYWKNKISPDTINLSPGETVTEIQVFEIRLNGESIDESVLAIIDRKIPYHIIYVLEYEGKCQVWTAYKEAIVSGTNAFKVGTYYHTEWLDETDLKLSIEGLNIDKVYESFVRQIAGDSLQQSDGQESLQESVEKDIKKKNIEKKIDELESKARKETQSKKKYEMFQRIKEYKNKLEDL